MSKPRAVLPAWGMLLGLILIGLLATQRVNLADAVHRNLGFIRLAAAITAPSEGSAAAIDDAHQWLARGQELFPEDHRLWYALALSYRFQGKVTEARSTIETYLQAVPGDMAGRFILGDIAYEAGDIAATLQSWSGRTNGMVFIQKAAVELEQGNLDEAQQLLGIALNGDITSYSTAYPLAEQYTLLAARLQKSGDADRINLACDSGSIAYQAAIAAEPSLGFVRINYGAFLRQCQRHQAAIAQFLSVDDSMKATARAWASHEIALTYRVLNQEEDALAYFERAVEMEPSNGLYGLSLGQAYARLGRTEEARAQFAEIISGADPQWKTLAEKELAGLR